MALLVTGHGAQVSTVPLEIVTETVPSSVARIRRFAVDAARAHDPAIDTDVVALLVSELTTNAMVHGEGHVSVRIVARKTGVRVEVGDASPAVPARRTPDLDAEGGRGIALVEALASSWGVELSVPSGKTVWFELDSEPTSCL